MALLELNNVSFIDNSQVIINSVSHSIEKGTVTAFLGKPGSGKSTALKLLAGLINPSKGKLLFEGKNVQTMNKAQVLEFRRRSAFMFQDSALWANQDILHNLELPLQIHFPQMNTKERWDRIHEMTALVEYTKSLSNRPAALSIGEQKKISFARALICRPEILFLDEPTESLDDKSVELVLTILKEFVAEGNTVIYVSHDNQLINSFMSDKIYFGDGEIQEKILLDDAMEIDDYYEDEL